MSRKIATIEFEDSANQHDISHILDNLIESDEWLSCRRENPSDSKIVYGIFTEFET